jgi:hypothetical protein
MRINHTFAGILTLLIFGWGTEIRCEDNIKSFGDLIGKTQQDFAVLLMKLNIKETPVISKNTDKIHKEDDTYWKYNQSGIEASWDTDGKLSTVWVNLSERWGRKPFVGRPYAGFSRDSSFEEVKNKLGKPEAENVENIPEIIKITPWLRYRIRSYLVHFQFSEDMKHLEQITFMPADWQPGR